MFALHICRKYKESRVLIKEPDKSPYSINYKGEMLRTAGDKYDTGFYNPPAEYYISFIKSRSLYHYNNSGRNNKIKSPIVFNCYINPNPSTINELRRRKDGYGELILMFNGKEL